MMYLAVVGSRTFEDYKLLEDTLNPIIEFNQYVTIVSGGALGADNLASKYAKEHGLDIIEYLPDWHIGKHAGMVRNIKIIEKADKVVAFWNGHSKGTAHSIELAQKYNKPVKIIRF